MNVLLRHSATQGAPRAERPLRCAVLTGSVAGKVHFPSLIYSASK
jgi:hypothetical protein